MSTEWQPLGVDAAGAPEWPADVETVDDVPTPSAPVPVPSAPVPVPASSTSVRPDLLADPVVVEALDARTLAEGRAAATTEHLEQAQDALLDARGALDVADARVADYQDDDSKKPWQRLAASEASEKARRTVAQRERAVVAGQTAAAAAGEELERAQRELEAILTAAEAADAAQPVEPELIYGSTDEFVREYLRFLYRRAQDGRIWCARWWEVDEAVVRLEALWRSWEYLRMDASTGMSVWWRDHADHHMNVLLSKTGPFAAHVEGEDHRLRQGQPLPYIAPPEGMFPDVREAPQAASTS